MRRQVKPFVTEYRGSVRRGKDPVASPEFEEVQTPRNRWVPDAPRGFQSDASEDPYEAALRAADALFAPADSHDSSVFPKDDVNAAAASSPHRPSRDLAAQQVFADDPPQSVMATDQPDRALPQGRILQAIEPPSEDRFAILEADRAPKRRGRKPGSKNKPKIAIVDDRILPAEQIAAVKAQLSPRMTPTPRPQPSFEPAEGPREALVELDDAGQTVGEIAAERPRGRNDKFGRKRVGLRPGERWKRRLPKAAW